MNYHKLKFNQNTYWQVVHIGLNLQNTKKNCQYYYQKIYVIIYKKLIFLT